MSNSFSFYALEILIRVGCPTSDKFKVGDSIFIHIDQNYYMGETLYGFTSNFVPIVEIDSVNHKLKVNANDITIRCDENELQYSGTSLLFYDMINDARRGAQTITRNFSSIPKQSRTGTTISKISFYESVPTLDQKFSPVDATGVESEIINSVSTPYQLRISHYGRRLWQAQQRPKK